MLREAEISDLHVSVCPEENVLRLQVSIDDVQGVEVIQRKCYLSGVELGDGVGETLPSVRGTGGRHLPDSFAAG